VSHDFDVGVEHLLRWDRIAIVTNLDWFRETVRALSFLMPGHVELFSLDEAPEAREWVLA
jgi:SpoIIAA-like